MNATLSIETAKQWNSGSSGRNPIAANTASPNRRRSSRPAISTACPYTLNSPSLPMRSTTVLCTTQRGSRIRSCALRDCHIIPRYRFPSTMNGSTGEIRGHPSRRSVPTQRQGPSKQAVSHQVPQVPGPVLRTAPKLPPLTSHLHCLSPTEYYRRPRPAANTNPPPPAPWTSGCAMVTLTEIQHKRHVRRASLGIDIHRPERTASHCNRRFEGHWRRHSRGAWPGRAPTLLSPTSPNVERMPPGPSPSSKSRAAWPGPLDVDVTDPNQIRNAVSQTVADKGRLDIMVNNAGVIVRSSAPGPHPRAVGPPPQCQPQGCVLRVSGRRPGDDEDGRWKDRQHRLGARLRRSQEPYLGHLHSEQARCGRPDPFPGRGMGAARDPRKRASLRAPPIPT